MKILSRIIFAIFAIFSALNLNAQLKDEVGHTVTQWSNWTTTECHKGIAWRLRQNYYSGNNNGYTWEYEVKNNYGTQVAFSYEFSETETSTGNNRMRKTLSPNQVYRNTALPNSNRMNYFVFSVCFSSDGRCKDACYSPCDNGTPNIPDCAITNPSSSENKTTATSNNNQNRQPSTYSQPQTTRLQKQADALSQLNDLFGTLTKQREIDRQNRIKERERKARETQNNQQASEIKSAPTTDRIVENISKDGMFKTISEYKNGKLINSKTYEWGKLSWEDIYNADGILIQHIINSSDKNAAEVVVRNSALQAIVVMLSKSQFSAAKSSIDSYFAEQKNTLDADAWYYKGRIYNSLSNDATVAKSDAYNYKMTAFNAFKENQQLDRLDSRMKIEFYKSYMDLYIGFYDLGSKNYNTKNYKAAYDAFTKALEVGNFIFSNTYTYKEIKFSQLDTTLLINIATSALQGSDTTNALVNYNKLINAGVKGKEYENIYQFLAFYYYSKNDNLNFQAILAKAKNIYPANKYWNELEVEQISKSGDTKNLFAKYDENYNIDPLNYVNSYNYAVEMYNYVWSDKSSKTDTTLFKKISTVLKSAINVDTDQNATTLLINHLFNVAAFYSEKSALIKEGKLTKPEQLKKKQILNESSMSYMNEFVVYGEKIITYYNDKVTLTEKQKNNYKSLTENLSIVYRIKGISDKAEFYEKLLATIK